MPKLLHQIISIPSLFFLRESPLIPSYMSGVNEVTTHRKEGRNLINILAIQLPSEN